MILCVGRLKEGYWVDAMQEYLRRLTPYAKIQVVEVDDECIPNRPSRGEIEVCQRREAERILKHLKSGVCRIALDPRGQQFTSEEFSEWLDDLAVQGKSDLCFVIGGPTGLTPSLLQSCHFRLSFSKMTFPHQLFRVMLIEQIYRAFRISRGEPYHL